MSNFIAVIAVQEYIQACIIMYKRIYASIFLDKTK